MQEMPLWSRRDGGTVNGGSRKLQWGKGIRSRDWRKGLRAEGNGNGERELGAGGMAMGKGD